MKKLSAKMALMKIVTLAIMMSIISEINSKCTCTNCNDDLRDCIARGYTPKDKTFIDNCDEVVGENKLPKKDRKKCKKAEKKAAKECKQSCREDDRTCPNDMVFSTCASACPRTCKNRRSACTRQCVRRCHCPASAPIQHRGKCITLDRCPGKQRCSGDMVFDTCASACPRTCAEPNPICTLQCVAKCTCPDDTPIQGSEKGSCISLDQC